MPHHPPTASTVGLPPARQFADLVPLTNRQRVLTLALPFGYAAAYFGFAALGWWVPAVAMLMGLSFVTYGSTSHDLVHANLGLRRGMNDFFLSIIELLALRSGHAYRLAHLHHHARYPAPDDIEGAAAGMSLFGALCEGVIYNFKLYFWALRHALDDKRWVRLEGLACVLIVALAGVLAALGHPVLLIYGGLMLLGSWLLPLITSYIPHRPREQNVLWQTRLFRGRVASLVAAEHLYHLEHHLYPAIPHHHWPQLAKRLDPYFAQQGVEPTTLGF
ncbi:fatty acid desaturase family protein [Hymenobacter properus]|uniref:Fatty acid desaturase n=1 Tax=Hymenobacter properus TaxID=2791026 RepID=A0A931FGY7_9BACT|nr:fatty acid desaturase [Hymenobacter properus]MBF9140472.1 fatty acid desaturase [Hymenobacter properus]MBR7719279.1 fatty acid desaturase [Microvirga sp. SRT04]